METIQGLGTYYYQTILDFFKKRVIILSLFFSACAVMQQRSVSGEFRERTTWMGSSITLSLSANGTFRLNWNNIDYSGKWESSTKRYIALNFDEIIDSSILLAAGTISDKEKTIEVVNTRKLKFDNWILKREK